MRTLNILIILELIFSTLLIINLVDAEVESLGTFKVGTNVNIIQTCSNCSFVNLTKVQYPNSTIEIIGISMTKKGTDYNYTFSKTSEIGTYIVSTCGDVDTELTCISYDFEINAIGFKSTDSRSDAANRGVYFLFRLAALLFMGFLFVQKPIFKWTFFLFSILFLVMGINIISITIYNDIGNTQIGAVFDQIGAASYIIYWLVFGLLFFMWILGTIASIADKKRMRQAEQVGSTSLDLT